MTSLKDRSLLANASCYFGHVLRHLAVLSICFVGSHAMALNVTAIYYASCKREVGVVLGVDANKISILTLDGEIRDLRRLDAIYLAEYPLSEVPIQKIENSDSYPGFTVHTLYDDAIVELVKGWPINFSKGKIGFLSLSGREIIVDRNRIWGVTPTRFAGKHTFPSVQNKVPILKHPYPFSRCPIEPRKNLSQQEIFPQQILASHLAIKQELDRLQEGYATVQSYSEDQRFYPVPQIYKNQTSLGIWYNVGSRYGKSERRSNSLIPAITSSLSEGPFGFQRKIVTGSAPLPFTMHEEPQNQFYYTLKADYVHFSYFFDIDRLLMGEELYKWQRDDLNTVDHRINEIDRLGGGFDYGNFAIGYGLSGAQYGLAYNESFFKKRAELHTVDFSYENRKLKGHFYFGRFTSEKGSKIGSREGDDDPDPNEPPEFQAAREAQRRLEEQKPEFFVYLMFLRLNLVWKWEPYSPRINFIYRRLDAYVQEDEALENEITYAARDFTTMVAADFPIDEDITVSGYMSFEAQRYKAGESFYVESGRRLFGKAGLQWSLSF